MPLQRRHAVGAFGGLQRGQQFLGAPAVVVHLHRWPRRWPQAGRGLSRGGPVVAPSLAAALADALERLAQLLRETTPATQPVAPVPAVTEQLPWSALLWVVPAETRIGRRELLAALGRPRSWLYRHT